MSEILGQFTDYLHLYIMRDHRLSTEDASIEQQLIARLKEEVVQREAIILERDSLITKRDLTIEKLVNELIALRRRLFGHSSERFLPEDPNQLSLAFEGEENLPVEVLETEKIEVSYTRDKENRKKPSREPIPESIRREETVIEPESIPEGAVKIGEEVTEKIEYIPGEVFVKRTVRPKYALPRDGGIIIADLPSQVLPRSNAGASLLSHLLVSKYQDHLPFYRQLEIFKRQNIHFPHPQ